MLLRVSISVEEGNAALKAGAVGPTVQRILADLKQEAAYFFADAIVQDRFAFNAKVSFRPVMTPEDLGAAMPSITKAVEQYGK
jgi:hypothetical protein